MTDPSKSAPKITDLASRLTLRGLSAFIAVEESGSIAVAARNLGMSKSSISQHITTLETSVGARLFDRNQRPISLTPAGQVLGMHARRIMSMISVAEASLAKVNPSSLPALNFAIIDDLDATITPVLAASMQTRLPNCHIRTFSGPSDQINERLMSRKADIAVTATVPDDMRNFQIQELAREKFVLVTAKGKYTPGPDWREQLLSMPLVQYSDAMPLGRQITAQLKRIGLHVPQRFSFQANRSLIATVATTGGWALATPLSILDATRFYGKLDLFALPFPGPTREIYMVSRMEELGDLPQVLGNQFRNLMKTELRSEFMKLAPHLSYALEVFGEPS